MKKTLAYGLLISALTGCQPSESITQQTTETSPKSLTVTELGQPVDAVLENGLAYDGCSTHIQVQESGSTRYFVIGNPGDVAVKQFIDRLRNTAKINVRISYQLTGRKTELLCGWNQKPVYDEISITAITDR